MLPKELRLPSIHIAPLMRHGKRVRNESMEIIFQKNQGAKRFAFIVSTRVDKRAVVRNRIKRVIREVVHRELSHITDNIEVIVVVKAKAPDTYDTMKPVLFNLFGKAGLMNL